MKSFGRKKLSGKPYILLTDLKYYAEEFQAFRIISREFNIFGIVFSSAQSLLYRIRYNSDRGCQYVSDAFRKATDGMVNSYSKKAYPWDNACIESFHALLKREWINRFKIFNYRHAYKLVFEYIETFYNTVRSHSHCGYLSPTQYEEEYYAALDEKAEALAG